MAFPQYDLHVKELYLPASGMLHSAYILALRDILAAHDARQLCMTCPLLKNYENSEAQYTGGRAVEMFVCTGVSPYDVGLLIKRGQAMLLSTYPTHASLPDYKEVMEFHQTPCRPSNL